MKVKELLANFRCLKKVSFLLDDNKIEEIDCTAHETIELLDIDHDAGDYAFDGGDFIKLLDWMELTNRSFPIRIHSMNPVGVENMRRIIQKNGWTEVL